MMTTGLENIVKADDVALDVSVGIGNGIPYPGLCSKVYYDIEMVGGE